MKWAPNMGKLDDSTRARIRNNQRRSRARHKEYVASLEERVRRCELKRLEANFEMQQAARKVVDENKKIRNLLNTLGYSNEDITCFLQTGNLDANDAIPPESHHDHESWIQTTDLLLQQYRLSISDYNTFTNTSFSSYGTSSSQCNSTGDDLIDSLINSQDKSGVHAPGTDEHVELYNPNAMDVITHELEAQGHLQYLEPSSCLAVGPLQRPTSSADPPGGLNSAQYITDIGYQDFMDLEQENRNKPMMDSYSSPPSRTRDSSYSISLGTASPNPEYQNYLCSGYPSSGKSKNNMAGVASNLLFSSDMSGYLT